MALRALFASLLLLAFVRVEWFTAAATGAATGSTPVSRSDATAHARPSVLPTAARRPPPRQQRKPAIPLPTLSEEPEPEPTEAYENERQDTVRGRPVAEWCAPVDMPLDVAADPVAITLVHAFTKAARHVGSGISMGVLVVSADLQLWRDAVLKVTWPLAQLTVVVNSEDAHTNAYFGRLTGAVAQWAARVHGETNELYNATVAKLRVVQPHANLGVAAGWNRLLAENGARAFNDAPQWTRVQQQERGVPAAFVERPPAWVLIANADVTVACRSVAAFTSAADRAATRAVHNATATPPAGEPYDACPRVDPATGDLRTPAVVPSPLHDPHAPVALYHLSAFAIFAAFSAAIADVGGFDENVWPAYGEDVEMALRLRASGRYTRLVFASHPGEPRGCAGDERRCGVEHAGSPSRQRDKRFAAMLVRWARGEYAFRKWGYDRRLHVDGMEPAFCPHAVPFNITDPGAAKPLLLAASGAGASTRKALALSFGSDFVFDDAHRRCVADAGWSTAGSVYYEAAERVRGLGASRGGGGDGASASCRFLCLQRFAALLAPDAETLLPPEAYDTLTTTHCHGVPNY